MQAVGAALALGLMTEFGTLEGLPDWTANAWEAPDAFGAMSMVAAGAVFWTVYSRCDAWVGAIATVWKYIGVDIYGFAYTKEFKFDSVLKHIKGELL